MGVPVCRCIVKSHSAKFWVFFALRCYLKIKGPRHLNKRWEIQLIVGRLSSQGQPHGSILTNRNMCIWGCVSSFPLLFQKWDDLHLIVIFVLYLFCGSFFLGQCDPQLETSAFSSSWKPLCCCLGCFLLMPLVLWKILAFQANCIYSVIITSSLRASPPCHLKKKKSKTYIIVK